MTVWSGGDLQGNQLQPMFSITGNLTLTNRERCLRISPPYLICNPSRQAIVVNAADVAPADRSIQDGCVCRWRSTTEFILFNL